MTAFAKSPNKVNQISITAAELAEFSGGILIPGQKYRITDQSDIIVIAETNSTYKYDIPITLAAYADNDEALAGGLVAGQWYRTSAGVVMQVYIAL
jgi:hypothetical protein